MSTLSNGVRRVDRRTAIIAPCRDRCSPSNARQRSCGCSPAAPGGSGSARSPRSLGLAKGTAHGILRTLQGVGFVEQDKASGKYQLGATLLHLGTSYLDVNELRSRAINWADALAARSGEAVRIGTLLDGKVLIVHHVFRPDDSLQSLDVGALLPLHATRARQGAARLRRAGGGRAARRPSWSRSPGAP